MNNIKDFDSSLLKIDKKSYKNMAIYYVGQITIKKVSECDNINSVNPLYLMIHGVTGHIKEKNGGKYLVISPDNGLMDEYKEGWGETKNEIKSINSDKKFEYDKDFMKSKFDSDDDL